MTRRSRLVVVVVAALVVAGAAAIRAQYVADVRAAGARVSIGSRIVTTRCGPIEYAEKGEGPVVLIVHGAGGGHDQGMLLGEPLAALGFRAIAMSRFGYLRTPAPADTSAEAQADAHACLLDALAVSHAAVIGVSAGGPSSLQFAIRHPDRCSALVLLVPLAYSGRSPANVAPRPNAAMRVALRALESDFAFWTLLELAPAFVTRTVLGTPTHVVASADLRERERLATVRASILPVSRRAAGLRLDGAVAGSLGRYDLESIRVPTLVFAVRDDLYGTYEGAQYTAMHIPPARLVEFASGGHMWVGHHEEVLSETAQFLDAWSRSGDWKHEDERDTRTASASPRRASRPGTQSAVGSGARIRSAQRRLRGSGGAARE